MIWIANNGKNISNASNLWYDVGLYICQSFILLNKFLMEFLIKINPAKVSLYTVYQILRSVRAVYACQDICMGFVKSIAQFSERLQIG